jgi:glutamate-1-semialdehyde 2,1-aminomutase
MSANHSASSPIIRDLQRSTPARSRRCNALSLAAMRATLENVLTPAAYEHMMPLAKRFCDDVAAQIRAADLPGNVTRLGCRAEYTFTPARRAPALNPTPHPTSR